MEKKIYGPITPKEKYKGEPFIPSTMNQYQNPNPNDKLRLDQGILNTFIKRKIRIAVETKLRNKHGRDYASNNWDHIAQMIIHTHLRDHDPAWIKIMTDGQAEIFKENYPFELQQISDVQKRVDEGKTLKQIQYWMGEG